MFNYFYILYFGLSCSACFLCRANSYALSKAMLSSHYWPVLTQGTWAGRKVLALAPRVSNTCFQKPGNNNTNLHLLYKDWTVLQEWNCQVGNSADEQREMNSGRRAGIKRLTQIVRDSLIVLQKNSGKMGWASQLWWNARSASDSKNRVKERA